jgi:hypothetical protein
LKNVREKLIETTPLSSPNSGQFSYPLPNMVHPLDTIIATGFAKIFLIS